MQTATDFRFNVFDMVSTLIYARVVHPCSKSKTYDEVIPKLFGKHDFSLDQLYSGLGLLLDARQIPIGMKMYPGNESEKAKTLKACEAKRSEYGDSAKYVSFVAADKNGSKTYGKIKVEINEKAIENAKKLAGYNMMVTSEIHMSALEIYAAYHNLWRIEESFRIMKSHLDARPVYLQKEETITGHFLICYLAVLLTRLLQIHVLNDKYGTEEIFDFIHDFRVAKVSDPWLSTIFLIQLLKTGIVYPHTV